MDISTSTLAWLAIAMCGAALAAVSARMISAIQQAAIQTDRVTQAAEEVYRRDSLELAITLQHTFADLSLQDRESKWYNARVARVDQESADTRSYYLLDEFGESLPSFLPGQHLLIERPAGTVAPVACRCYTLSDDVRAGYWRITVKRACEHPTSVSRWLHDEVHEGDYVRVRGPSGAFFLKSCTARNIVFLSAGVGITPMIPMLLEGVRRPHGSIHFLAQYRDIEHAPFAEELLAFAQSNRDIRIRLWLSRFPQGIVGAESNVIREGKFSASEVCSEIDSLSETDVYLCGPEAWINGMRGDLVLQGVPEENLYYELFHSTPPVTPLPPPQTVPDRPPCSVHFRQSNRLAEFAANYPSLLSFASQSDVPIASGCRTGACGSCAVRLLQGKVRYTRKPQYPLKANEILPCVCVPDGNIVVDV